MSDELNPRPMHTAPRDGTTIEVLCKGEWWTVFYWDCEHLREDEIINGHLVKGEPVNDAWAIENAEGPGCIELSEAEAWMPVEFADDK